MNFTRRVLIPKKLCVPTDVGRLNECTDQPQPRSISATTQPERTHEKSFSVCFLFCHVGCSWLLLSCSLSHLKWLPGAYKSSGHPSPFRLLWDWNHALPTSLSLGQRREYTKCKTRQNRIPNLDARNPDLGNDVNFKVVPRSRVPWPGTWCGSLCFPSSLCSKDASDKMSLGVVPLFLELIVIGYK